MAASKVGVMKIGQNFKNTTIHILSTLLILTSFNSFSTASAITYPAGDWQVSTPEEQGMESRILAEMMDYIQKYNFNIDSIFIVRNGFEVFDACFGHFQKDKSIIFIASVFWSVALFFSS